MPEAATVQLPAQQSPEESGPLLHALRVHQIELEMQNEELCRIQVELEASRARYFDLYDLAPVGYVTLSEAGLIVEANLKAATLLGVNRRALVREPLARFIVYDDLDLFGQICKRLVESGAQQVAELRLRRADGAPVWTQLEMTAAQGPDGGPVCRAVIGDITAHKQIEAAQLFLLECGYAHAGEDFFRALARYLAESLDMDYVCIDRLLGDRLTAQTVAIYSHGAFESNVAYSLQNTPCGAVVGKSVCCFPREVRQLFPRDAALQELKAESYVGTTLWSCRGQPIGLIAVIGRQPLANPTLAEAVLKLVAVRAAGELERRQAEEELRRANAALETAARELQKSLSREQLLARTDALTGLYNRRQFFEIAAREFRSAVRYSHPLCVLLFDVDGFKHINDSLGHTAGDMALVQIAQTAAAHIRAVDVLARYGGDEFVVLLPQTNAQKALPVAEHIRESVAALRQETDQGPVSVTVSTGIAELRLVPPDQSIEAIVRHADEALYESKAVGRNCTLIFSEERKATTYDRG